MAAALRSNGVITKKSFFNACIQLQNRTIQTTAVYAKAQAGRYKASVRKNFPLTYEMANKPHHIGVRKAWNSWNTSTLLDGFWKSEMAVDDMFIRKFITGTFAASVLSEVIIKRQYNMIRISFVLHARLMPEKICFLIGYCEELLSHWFQCPVKLELQCTTNHKAMVIKYV